MIYLYIILALCVLGILIFLWLRKPKVNRRQTRENVQAFLKTFLLMGTDGSLLHIWHEGSEKFLQYRVDRSSDFASLSFGFPDADWSRLYFSRVAKAFEENEVNYSVIETQSESVPSFVQVNDIPDAESAMKIFNIACLEMEIPEQATFRVVFEGYIRPYESGHEL